MERNSRLEHFGNMTVPRKPIGLMKSTAKNPLTRKQLDASKRMDDRKDSSLRGAGAVPGAVNKQRTYR